MSDYLKDPTGWLRCDNENWGHLEVMSYLAIVFGYGFEPGDYIHFRLKEIRTPPGEVELHAFDGRKFSSKDPWTVMIKPPKEANIVGGVNE